MENHAANDLITRLRARGVRLIAASDGYLGWTPDAAVSAEERSELVRWREEVRVALLREHGGRLTIVAETFADHERFATEWIGPDDRVAIATPTT